MESLYHIHSPPPQGSGIIKEKVRSMEVQGRLPKRICRAGRRDSANGLTTSVIARTETQIKAKPDETST